MPNRLINIDTVSDIAGMIDHSLLPPSLSVDELERGCQQALHFKVASVCIMPYYLKRCAAILKGSSVKASTTIGFPHGGHSTAIKLAEAKQALDDGAQELDMVVNISQVLSGNWDEVRNEISAVTQVTHASNQKIKVIFENCYLDREQKIRLCEICSDLDVDWIKTSTGFRSGGATKEDVILMREHAPERVQIKAAGGIRTLDQLLEFRALGVSRVGASQTETIINECKRRLGV